MESYNIKDDVKEKLKNLKEKSNQYSEKRFLLTKTTTTELKNVIEKYDLKDPKNKQKRIISLLDSIYHINSINLVQV